MEQRRTDFYPPPLQRYQRDRLDPLLGKKIDSLGTLTLGAIYYDLHWQKPSYSAEVYASLALDESLFGASEAILNPTFSAYFDSLQTNGFYLRLDLSHSFDLSSVCGLSQNWSLDLGSSLGWSSGDNIQHWYGEDDARGSFTHFMARLGLTIPLLKTEHSSLKFKPFISWFSTLDRIHQNSGLDQEAWVGGASLLLEF